MAEELLHSGWSCTPRCRSKDHASLLSSALGKAPALQTQAFLLSSCRNFSRLTDSGGRSLVHWAASRGNLEVMHWLITHFRPDFSSKDTESGYTPLHRSVIHGHISCTQFLIDSGASINSQDQEGLGLLDLVHKDQSTGGFSLREPVELYSYGENMSYNLGHAHPTPRLLPEPVDYFRRNGIFISKVSMSKFHSLFLSRSGEGYACGHGLGGRLGLGSEEPQFRPALISSLKEPLVDLAAATDHSLFLDLAGNAFSCGRNTLRQLGYGRADECVLEPEVIRMPKGFKEKFVGCGAGSCHSLLWTEDSSLFTFGSNAGHLGHAKADGDFIGIPKKVSGFGPSSGTGSSEQEKRVFIDVNSSDGAIVVATGFESPDKTEDSGTKATRKGGEVWLLYSFQKLRIASRQLETKSVHAVGGRRCFFSGTRQIYPTDVALHRKGLVAVCADGRAFRGSFGPLRKDQASLNPQSPDSKHHTKEKRAKQVSGPITWRSRNLEGEFLSFLEQSECQSVSLSRLPGAHRSLSAFVDWTGKNVMLIQQIPSANLTEIPVVRPGELSEDMEALLSEADCADVVHDLEILAANRRYPVHRFVIECRAPGMLEAVGELQGSEKEWKLPPWANSITPSVLEEFLNFLYTDDCALLRVGTRWTESGLAVKQPMREQNSLENQETKKKKKKGNKQTKAGDKLASKATKESGGRNPLRQIQELGRKFGVKSLVKKAECVQWDAESGSEVGTLREVKHKTVGPPRIRFEITSHLRSCDIQLLCQDNVELKAHRCMLVGRIEYFRCMLGSEWMEGAGRRGTPEDPTSVKIPFQSDVVRVLLYYVYTDELHVSGKQKTQTEVPDILCRLLVCADQLLMERLRELCEASIAETITLRNAAELLQFAQTYNARELRNTCLQFICLNLATFLDSNALQGLDAECLDSIGVYYRRMYSHVGNRLLTPSWEDPSVERIQTVYSRLLSSSLSVDELLAAFLAENQSETSGVSHPPSTPKTPGSKKKASQFSPSVKLKLGDVEKSRADPVELTCSSAGVPSWSPPPPPLDVGSSPENAWKCAMTPVPSNRSFLETVEERKDPLDSYFSRRRKEAATLSERPNSKRIMAWCETPDSPPTEGPLVSLTEVMAKESEQANKEKLTRKALFGPLSPRQGGNVSKLDTRCLPWGGAGQSDSVQQTPIELSPGKQETRSFKEIVEEEEGRVAEKVRQERKPLFVIQMEELAMEELLVSYEADKNFDSLITVERVTGVQIPDPIWQAHV